MKASDVMVSTVITVGPNTTVQEIANILLFNRISAVPVVDAKGALIGIVSEGDLIPSPIDQNPFAHWRNPMDMILQG